MRLFIFVKLFFFSDSENFHLLQNGELLFEKVNQEIASWKYRCIAIDVLNQEQVVSSWVKFIIKGKQKSF